MAKRWKWGFLGTGHIAGIMRDALATSERAELYAVASRDGTRADAFAAESGGVRAYGAYDGLLGDPDVEIVYIALPNALHREWAEKAAAAGKHILVEKPLAQTESDVAAMFATAARHGVTLMEAFKYPFHPQWPKMQEILADGRLGDLRSLQGTFAFRLQDHDNVRLQKSLAGGAVWDLGCYPVSFFTLLMNAEPVQVRALAHYGHVSGVDETLVACLEYPGPVYAQFECSFATVFRQRGEIACDGGVLQIPELFHPTREAPTTLTEIRGGKEVVHMFPVCNAFTGEADHFCECVESGAEPGFTQQHSLWTVRTIERLLADAGKSGGL